MTQDIKISVLSDEKRTFPPSPEFSANAHIKTMAEYQKLYDRSVKDPEGFWAEMAEQRLTWFRKWDKVLDYDFHKPYIKWFSGGKLNVSVNCLDRHCTSRDAQQGRDHLGGRRRQLQDLHLPAALTEVNRFANVLRKNGVKKGDGVTMYLQMIPELAIAVLACTRIGAIHSVVFGGFSSQSLRDRIQDCKSAFLVTQDNAVRGGKTLPQKANADVAVGECPTIKKVFVVHRAGEGAPMTEGRDLWWHEEVKAADIRTPASPSRWTPRTRSSSSTPPAPPASPRAWSTPRPATRSTPT